MDQNTKNRFKARVREWAAKLDTDVHIIAVRTMKRKWASCSTTGILTFDTHVPDLSPDLQDYIIVHELLHFQIPNHGKLWKCLMRAHLGEYEKREEQLKVMVTEWREQAGSSTAQS